MYFLMLHECCFFLKNRRLIFLHLSISRGASLLLALVNVAFAGAGCNFFLGYYLLNLNTTIAISLGITLEILSIMNGRK